MIGQQHRDELLDAMLKAASADMAASGPAETGVDVQAQAINYVSNLHTRFEAYRTATKKLLSVVLTGRRENTREWFTYLVESINQWAAATGEPDRVWELNGQIKIVKGGGE